MQTLNNPKLKSWLEVAADSDFPIQNLPFGVFKTPGGPARVGIAIGDHVLDCSVLAVNGFFEAADLPPQDVFSQGSLNPLLKLGPSAWRSVRARASTLLAAGNDELKSNSSVVAHALLKMSEVQMLRPVEVGAYVDFYSSIEHATNVGKMFRDAQNPLLPNWKHIPIGYNGRASSVVVSGTPIHRPLGQLKSDDAPNPEFAPCKQLDFELELGFVAGRENPLGHRISIDEAEDYIFGVTLVNDWSARDIQRWEYVPLGPFLAKSFATSMSPWIVTLDALEPYRIAAPEKDVEPLPYLRSSRLENFDIELEVLLRPRGQASTLSISKTNFKYMYWSMPQQLTHAASNGTNIQVGDLYATGTISGPTPDSLGSMLELCWKGTRPIVLPNGEKRVFLQDGDEVIMRGYASRPGLPRIGLGEVVGEVLPVWQPNV